MFTMTPSDEDLHRIIIGLEQGLPEEGSPAAQGGFGAEITSIGDAERDLIQEGVFDENLDRESHPATDGEA